MELRDMIADEFVIAGKVKSQTPKVRSPAFSLPSLFDGFDGHASIRRYCVRDVRNAMENDDFDGFGRRITYEETIATHPPSGISDDINSITTRIY